MDALCDSGGFGWRRVLRVSVSAAPACAPRQPSVCPLFDVFGQAVTTIVTSAAKSRRWPAAGEKFPRVRRSARLLGASRYQARSLLVRYTTLTVAGSERVSTQFPAVFGVVAR